MVTCWSRANENGFGVLASISSQTELDAILKFLKENGQIGAPVWFGLTSLQSNTTFGFLDGRSTAFLNTVSAASATFQLPASYTPQLVITPRCGAVAVDESGNASFRQLSCSGNEHSCNLPGVSLLGFICKMPMVEWPLPNAPPSPPPLPWSPPTPYMPLSPPSPPYMPPDRPPSPPLPPLPPSPPSPPSPPPHRVMPPPRPRPSPPSPWVPPSPPPSPPSPKHPPTAPPPPRPRSPRPPPRPPPPPPPPPLQPPPSPPLTPPPPIPSNLWPLPPTPPPPSPPSPLLPPRHPNLPPSPPSPPRPRSPARPPQPLPSPPTAPNPPPYTTPPPFWPPPPLCASTAIYVKPRMQASFGSNLYTIFYHNATWPGAQEICEFNNVGNLLSLHSQYQLQWVLDKLVLLGMSRSWLGLVSGYGNLTSVGPPMQYVGLDGAEVDWIVGRRGRFANLGCVGQGCCGMMQVVNSSSAVNAQLVLATCFTSSMFICEAPFTPLHSSNGTSSDFSSSSGRVRYDAMILIRFVGAKYDMLKADDNLKLSFNISVSEGIVSTLGISSSNLRVTNLTAGSVVANVSLSLYSGKATTLSDAEALIKRLVVTLQGDVSAVFGSSFVNAFGVTGVFAEVLNLGRTNLETPVNIGVFLVPALVVPLAFAAVGVWIWVLLRARARRNPQPQKKGGYSRAI